MNSKKCTPSVTRVICAYAVLTQFDNPRRPAVPDEALFKVGMKTLSDMTFSPMSFLAGYDMDSISPETLERFKACIEGVEEEELKGVKGAQAMYTWYQGLLGYVRIMPAARPVFQKVSELEKKVAELKRAAAGRK